MQLGLLPVLPWGFQAAPERPGPGSTRCWPPEQVPTATGTRLLGPDLRTCHFNGAEFHKYLVTALHEVLPGILCSVDPTACRQTWIRVQIIPISQTRTFTSHQAGETLFSSFWDKRKHTQKCKKNLRGPLLAPSLIPSLSPPAREPDFSTGQSLHPPESPGYSPTLSPKPPPRPPAKQPRSRWAVLRLTLCSISNRDPVRCPCFSRSPATFLCSLLPLCLFSCLTSETPDSVLRALLLAVYTQPLDQGFPSRALSTESL